MAGLGRTIAGRITLGVLAIHVLVLPTLYFGLVYLIKDNNLEMFLNSSRTHARFLADSLERIGNPDSEPEIIELLDSVVLSGGGVFSELAGEKRIVRSSLVGDAEAAMYEEDLQVSEHGDNVYFISVPIMIGETQMNLRVGFDESPLHDVNTLAYKNGLIVISIYLAALLILMPVIGRRVVSPVKDLQRSSQQISSGDFSENLTVESDLVEFIELSTDLERMKSRLTGMNQRLEREILEREESDSKRRSLEQQLRHSQRLETVGTMAGGIAHELNNILVPIILNAEMAIEDLPENNPVGNDIKVVLRAARRAKGIVNQVLTFSNKMAGGQHVPVRLADVLRESIEFLHASLPPTVDLDVGIRADNPMVLGDPALLNQLILNLCTNALQSLGNSTGSVSVTLDFAEASKTLAISHPNMVGKRLVRLAVSDTGSGMNAETRERIFEPFFTTRSVGEGTGLGLSVVHGIVTDAKGAIEVESALESGSTFCVYLPALDPVSKTEDRKESG